MSEDLVAKLDALEKEATPGPWKASGPYASDPGSHYCEPCDMHEEHSPKDCPGNVFGPVLVDVGDYGTFNQPDSHLIVELRNAYPKLRAIVVAAQAYSEAEAAMYVASCVSDGYSAELSAAMREVIRTKAELLAAVRGEA